MLSIVGEKRMTVKKKTNEGERSDNGKKLRPYPAKTKVEAVMYAEIQ